MLTRAAKKRKIEEKRPIWIKVTDDNILYKIFWGMFKTIDGGAETTHCCGQIVFLGSVIIKNNIFFGTDFYVDVTIFVKRKRLLDILFKTMLRFGDELFGKFAQFVNVSCRCGKFIYD